MSEIDGVKVTPLRRIADERGAVFHMLREDSDVFERFGEIYFSMVYPGVVKAWHIHRRMTLNYAVPVGMVKLVCYDDRAGSPHAGCGPGAPRRRAQLRACHHPAARLERLQGRGPGPGAGRELRHDSARPRRDRPGGPLRERDPVRLGLEARLGNPVRGPTNRPTRGRRRHHRTRTRRQRRRPPSRRRVRGSHRPRICPRRPRRADPGRAVVRRPALRLVDRGLAVLRDQRLRDRAPVRRPAHRRASAPELVPYALRRGFRIFPLYWVAVTTVIVVNGLAGTQLWQVPFHYALLQNLVPGQQEALLTVAWTLTIEVLFYVAVPLLALGVQRGGCARSQPSASPRSFWPRWGVSIALTLIAGLAAGSSTGTVASRLVSHLLADVLPRPPCRDRSAPARSALAALAGRVAGEPGSAPPRGRPRGGRGRRSPRPRR